MMFLTFQHFVSQKATNCLLMGYFQNLRCVSIKFRWWMWLYFATRLLGVTVVLYPLHATELFNVIAECGFSPHSYADDTQMCVSTAASDHIQVTERLTRCISCIHDWIASNQLKLINDKTQIICLGTRLQLRRRRRRKIYFQ